MREKKNSFMNDACASAGDKNLINVNLKEEEEMLTGVRFALREKKPFEVETPLEKASHALELGKPMNFDN